MRRSVICNTHRRRLQVIDDPGGNKARLEHTFNKNIWMSPEEIKTIMLLKAKMLHDVEIHNDAEGKPAFQISPEPLVKPEKIRPICDLLHKWGVAQIVKDALNNLNGRVTEPIEVDLHIGARVDEFEIEKADDSV